MVVQDKNITWNKIADDQWQTNNPKRTYIGIITYVPGLTPYQLSITPGPVNSNHDTLRNAKNEFRKFLFNKPVV